MVAAMATFQVTAPESFDTHYPENWTKWIRRFERFRQASGLASKSEENQVNTLVYSMGDEADDILASSSTETAREREAIKQQQEILRKHFQEETQIDIVSQDKKSNGIQCGRKYYQERHKCPALYATCYKCHRKGHFQAVCLSQIKEIRSDPTAEVNAAFLGAVHDSMEEQPWETLVYLNNKSLVFKLDTGADVTVISSADFVEYRKTVKLKPPDRQLYGPGSAILPVIGYFLGTL